MWEVGRVVVGGCIGRLESVYVSGGQGGCGRGMERVYVGEWGG